MYVSTAENDKLEISYMKKMASYSPIKTAE